LEKHLISIQATLSPFPEFSRFSIALRAKPHGSAIVDHIHHAERIALSRRMKFQTWNAGIRGMGFS
jgi:hypothetical protein